MKKSTKIWLITAVFLIVLGSSIFVIAMFKIGWDFTKLSTVKFETNTYELTDEFNSISISADTADVKIVKSETEKAKVICFERENFKHAVIVNSGVLEIAVDNQTSLKGYIGINFQNPSITIYLPDNAYSNLNVKSVTSDIEISKDFTFENINVEVSTGDIKCFATVESNITLKTSTGDIKIENLTVNSLSLSTSTGKISANNLTVNEKVVANVSTGKVSLKNITCKNFESSGSTGDVYLENVIAVEKIYVKRNTGDVEFDGIDASEIEIKTSTGEVEGLLLTEKTFTVKTNTGDVDVPITNSGGICKITTDTGDIDIQIK